MRGDSYGHIPAPRSYFAFVARTSNVSRKVFALTGIAGHIHVGQNAFTFTHATFWYFAAAAFHVKVKRSVYSCARARSAVLANNLK